MKKSAIIGLVFLAVAIGLIVSSISDSSTYSNLLEASKNPGQEFHVVGHLDKTQAIIYDPTINPNLTIFYMTDNDGNTAQVFLNKSKPQDFERSENIVLIGKHKDNAFYATDVLMKCPSKYDEENELGA